MPEATTVQHRQQPKYCGTETITKTGDTENPKE